MAGLNIPAFPVHANTFQGTASALSLDDKPYKLVHADGEGTVTITFENGVVPVTLYAGEDINIAGAISVTSTASIKVS